MLAVEEEEGKARLMGRVMRWESWEAGPDRGSGELEKSTLLRQRMVMAGWQVGEIWRVDSRRMSRRPRLLGEADGRGGGFDTRFAGGWILYRNVMVPLGRHWIGIGRGLMSSIWPSEARETLAWSSRTSKVAYGVTSKSRLAMVMGCGEVAAIREHRIRADTAGQTEMALVG